MDKKCVEVPFITKGLMMQPEVNQNNATAVERNVEEVSSSSSLSNSVSPPNTSSAISSSYCPLIIPEPRSVGPLDNMIAANAEWEEYYKKVISFVSSYKPYALSSSNTSFDFSLTTCTKPNLKKGDLRANCQKWQSKWYLMFKPLPQSENADECSYSGYTLLNIWKKPNLALSDKPNIIQDKTLLKQLAKNILQGEAPKNVHEHSLSKLKHNKSSSSKRTLIDNSLNNLNECHSNVCTNEQGLTEISRMYKAVKVDGFPRIYNMNNKGIGRGSIIGGEGSLIGEKRLVEVSGSTIGGKVPKSGYNAFSGDSVSAIGGRSAVSGCGKSVIGAGGRSVIGAEGRSVIGAGGRSVIGAGGRSVIGASGRSLIGAGGRSLIGAGGRSLIGAGGRSVISGCGKSVVSGCNKSIVSGCGRSIVGADGRNVVDAGGGSVVGRSVVSGCGGSVVGGRSVINRGITMGRGVVIDSGKSVIDVGSGGGNLVLEGRGSMSDNLVNNQNRIRGDINMLQNKVTGLSSNVIRSSTQVPYHQLFVAAQPNQLNTNDLNMEKHVKNKEKKKHKSHKNKKQKHEK